MGPANATARLGTNWRQPIIRPHGAFLQDKCHTVLAPPTQRRLPRVAETAVEAPSIEEVVLASGTPEAEAVSHITQEPVQWTKNWYPVAIPSLLDRTRPNPVSLLGRHLVVWVDGEGQWRCFEDRCPHRAAPLSEGKIWTEGGTQSLMCSYHGWRFDEEGHCNRIPQAASAEAEERACSSLRSCATVYPVAEAQNLLFVWGEAGVEAEKEASAAPLPIDPLLEAALKNVEAVQYVMRPYFRDLPYDYQTLVENVVDPAHVPFSHHGVQGNRDKVKYGDYELKIVPDPGSMTVSYKAFFGPGKIRFTPPCKINYVRDDSDGGYFSFSIFAVPTVPGNSRLISFTTTNAKNLSRRFKMITKIPLWLDHLFFRHPVLDGDNVFLHFQEQFMAERANKEEDARSGAWQMSYFLPTRADALVAAFKNWLDKAGGGGPFGPLHKAASYSPLVTDHRVLLNRYEQHTKHCQECLKALSWVERLRVGFAAVAATGFGMAISAFMQAAPAKLMAAGALVGFVGALLWHWMDKLRAQFYFVEYDHSTR